MEISWCMDSAVCDRPCAPDGAAAVVFFDSPDACAANPRQAGIAAMPMVIARREMRLEFMTTPLVKPLARRTPDRFPLRYCSNAAISAAPKRRAFDPCR